MTNKLLPVALVAALIGGSVGAFVMHSKNATTTEPQTTTATTPATTTDAQYAQYQANASGNGQYVPAEYTSASEQNAYKSGFADGFRACESGAAGNRVATSYAAPAYRNTGRTYARNSSSTRRVYYDYQRPQGRSFWQKHRDKLTVAMGTGGGALIGGLIGGKKGAGIGALAGAGGSALYTYKLRNRTRRY
ncbi:MAG TPA: hypothetical protein VK208_19045 [Pyrinomonadaceae bacterium]|nr:hypothetical protein [Pyrinomonadaceae bacterium]